MNDMRYWINVVSKDHTMRGVSGGFMQSCHGKAAPLKRMSAGDWVIFYSPRLSLQGTEKHQKFTALGQATDEDIYQIAMRGDFVPFRRRITFVECTETPIDPLIDKLHFIKNKSRWGYPFRFGFFEIPKHDFDVIASLMVQDGLPL